MSAVVFKTLEPARRQLRPAHDDAGALLDYLAETASARRRRQLASPCPRSQLVAPWLRDLPTLVGRSGREPAVCVARRYAGPDLAWRLTTGFGPGRLVAGKILANAANHGVGMIRARGPVYRAQGKSGQSHRAS